MKDLFGVFGAGGYGREVMPIVQNTVDVNKYDFVFVVDAEYKVEEVINGIPVYTFAEFIDAKHAIKNLSIAVADYRLRKEIYEKSIKSGIGLPKLIANNVVLLAENTILDGAILSPFVTITSNCYIGKGFHANLYSYVGHDCVIGDYVTFSPGVKCSGNVTIENNVFVGTGAIIRPGTAQKPLVIGEGAIIAMGAVVTKDVSAGSTVIGNPGKIIKSKI